MDQQPQPDGHPAGSRDEGQQTGNPGGSGSKRPREAATVQTVEEVCDFIQQALGAVMPAQELELILAAAKENEIDGEVRGVPETLGGAAHACLLDQCCVLRAVLRHAC